MVERERESGTLDGIMGISRCRLLRGVKLHGISVGWLHAERRCVYEANYMAPYASPPENPMAGLTLAYVPPLVDRRESRPVQGDGQ